MRSFWTTVVFSFLAAVAASASPYPDVKTIRSDARGFSFSLEVPSDLSTLDQRWLDSARVTYERTIVIGIPYGASARLAGAEGHKLAAVAGGVMGGSKDVRLPLAEITPVRTVRGRQTVAVVIRPVVEASVYSEVEISVEFEGGMVYAGFSGTDPIFDRILAVSLANYDQVRQWPVPARALARPAGDEPFALAPTWFKIAVASTGWVRVTGAELRSAGLVLSNIPSDNLRLYNSGGQQLPVPNESPRPEFRETGIRVADGGDGIFGANDTLYFYGEGLNRFLYDDFGQATFHRHHYTEQNIYWLAVTDVLPGPAVRIGDQVVTPLGTYDALVTTQQRAVRLERDSLLQMDSDGAIYDYYRWFWMGGLQFTAFAGTPNLVAGQEVKIEVSAAAPYPDTLQTLAVNSVPASTIECHRLTGCTFASTAFVAGINELTLGLGGNVRSKSWLDYVQFSYTAYLQPVGDELEAVIRPETPGRSRVEIIDAFSANPSVLDITDPRRPVNLVGYDRSQGLLTMELEGTPAARVLYAFTPSQTRAAASIEKVTVNDLRQIPGQADLIIVTDARFVPALQAYREYRSSQGVSMQTVLVSDIYDNFSGGLVDPTAIRDFLKFAYENYPGPPPAMVLFLGDGNYDFLNHRGFGAPNYVPPFVNPVDTSYSYSDDNYLFFGSYGRLDSDSSYVLVPDRGVDMVSARWAVRTPQEVATIIDKIKEYETPQTQGPWRANVTLVADDEFGDSTSNEILHTEQSERLTAYIPNRYNLNKIYAIEYPFVNDGKPAVNDAIVKAFNDGSLLVNYVGHGNPLLWAHEHIFTSGDDLPRLHNYDRLALVYAASCAIGFFDDPEISGMAELLLNSSSGGAVAVVSATRMVYSSRNHAFNRAVFEVLFGNEELTLAEAIYAAKIRDQYQSSTGQILNDRSYVLFGDPLLRLGSPALSVTPTEPIDSLVSLRPTRVAGQIVDRQGAPHSAEAVAQVTVYDSDKQRTYVSTDHGGTAQPISYSVDGPTIYRGSAPIHQGQFALEFVPPLDIAFGGSDARVSVYVGLDSIAAAGAFDSIAVSNQAAPTADGVGPEITYTIGGRQDFVSGDVVSSRDALQLTLADTSGINLTGWLGHAITLQMDNNAEAAVNLTELFHYDEGSYTRGRIEWPLSSLTAGRHSFKVKAWDNANNSAAVEFAAEIAGEENLAIQDLLNWPNPMQDSTWFGFCTTVPLRDLTLDIFTLSGRKIWSFPLYSLDADCYMDRIVWHGCDFAGDRVATGVYIYKVTARSLDGRQEDSQFGKVVVIN